MATVEEAIDALTQLGLPPRQLEERSGPVLLALLDLTPEKSWREASAPLRGITPMMDFTLSPGGQNVLIVKVLEDFCPGFTPGARVLYVVTFVPGRPHPRVV